jgi:uncharacterized membrane protein
MDKYEFLFRLGQVLEGSNNKERKEIVGYYEELIQDAIDSGKEEADFIDQLGSVEKIARTLKKDQGFVENVKQKQNFQLQNVFSNSVKIVGYVLFWIAIFVIGSIAFSFLASGVSLFFFAAIRITVMLAGAFDVTNVLMFAGLILLGTGITLLGLWMVRWMIKESKGKLEKLLESIQALLKKEGQ